MTNKKNFIFGCGAGWAGTTSLHRTLAITQNYLHTGFQKESHYLTYALLYANNIINPFETHKEYFFNREEKESTFLGAARRIVMENKFFVNAEEPYNKEDYLSVVKKFTPEQINHFLTPPYTLDKYLNYVDLLSTYSEGKYQAVGDFFNGNYRYPFELETQFDIFKKEIEKKFNFKFLIILRDPIRRFFSTLNSEYHDPRKQYSIVKNYESASIYFLERILNGYVNLFDYAEFITKIQKKYGKENIHYVIMEDFFSDNNSEEVSKLAKFLDTEIKDVYPCCFVPDKGINAPKIPHLKDQWNSDHEVLTPEFYNAIRKHSNSYYENFERFHGYLPANWGRPIDYGY